MPTLTRSDLSLTLPLHARGTSVSTYGYGEPLVSVALRRATQRATMIEEGKKAPAFSLKDQNGKTVKLSDFAGKNVVLYFYPKDNTPGCTTEACDFRDQHTKLEKAGAVVLGVSPDAEKTHLKFIGKFELPFTLLADTEHAVAEKYGSWGEKSLYGRKFMGIIRSTFLIGADGKVAKVWPKVKVAGHVDEVLEAVKSLK